MGSENEVLLVGRAELDAIYQSLKKISEHSKAASQEAGNLGKKTQEGLEQTTRKTESGIKRSGSMMRRLASQLYSDFKGLISLQSTLAGLKLSNQFSGSVKESIKLSDSVRRLGNSFGVAKSEFGYFQAKLARGLGDIGASSEAASNALEGMAGFGVEGIESATALAKGAVTLAGIGGEKGNEKQIAGQLASTLQAQGKDVNDMKAQKALVGEVTAAVTATGKSASEILGAMDQIFSSMPKELRQSIGPAAMAQMATVATTVGPSGTKALQEYLSKTTEQRMAMEAQGFNVFKDGKLDLGALKSFIKDTESRGLSSRASLQTAGFSEDAAEGLVRIAEKSDLVQQNLEKLSKSTRDSDEAFKKTLGFADAFRGSINTVKGYFEEAFMGGNQLATDVLSDAVGDPLKSGAVVAGGATLAAILAGGGMRGIGSLIGGEMKSRAIEAATGEQVQKVEVINWPATLSIPGGAPGAGAAGGLMGKIGGAAAAGAAGYAVGEYLVNPALDKYTQGTTSEGFEGNAIEQLIFKMDKWFGGEASSKIIAANQKIQVNIETKEPNLRAKTGPTRGSSN